MHELSIALNIVELVRDEISKKGDCTVTSLTIEAGELSGVVNESLVFALEQSVKNTEIENTEIEIISIPGKAKCSCGEEFPATDIISCCPKCNNITSNIIEGRELKIRSITINENQL